MQHTSNYNYIHATLAEYVNPSDLALIVMAALGWAVTWCVRLILARTTEQIAIRRAQAEKQQAHLHCSSKEEADIDEQPASGIEQVMPAASPQAVRSNAKANAEARRRARREQKAKEAAVLQQATCCPDNAVEMAKDDNVKVVEVRTALPIEIPALEIPDDVAAAIAGKRQKRKTRKAKQAKQESQVESPSSEQQADSTALANEDEALEAEAETPVEVMPTSNVAATETTPEEVADEAQSPLEEGDAKKEAANHSDDDISGSSTVADDQTEESSDSGITSRSQSIFSLEEQREPQEASQKEPSQKEEASLQAKKEPEEAVQQLPHEEQHTVPMVRPYVDNAALIAELVESDSDTSSQADPEEISSLFAQVPEQWLSQEVVAAEATRASMTPLKKEVMKIEKQLRKVENLKARLANGESLDKLQVAAIGRAGDLQAKLETAGHQLAVEEVTAEVRPSHYYLWDMPQDCMYFCMPSNTTADQMDAYTMPMPAMEVCKQPWSQAAWVAPAAHWGDDDGWMSGFEGSTPTVSAQCTWFGRGRHNSNKPKPWEEEDWDLCWSFKNKGFCARGANCTWRHEGDERADMEAPLSEEEKKLLQERVEKLDGEQLDGIFEFLAPEIGGEDEEEEEEVSLDPDTLSPSRQRALFKLVERAFETLPQEVTQAPEDCIGMTDDDDLLTATGVAGDP